MAIKEINFRPQQMDDKEYQFKFDNVIRFLDNGDQVKLIARFRGRELAHKEIGERELLRFAQDLDGYASAEWPPVVEGRQMFVVFTAKRK